MFQIRRLITTAALALCAALPTAAMAQNVLVLATNESGAHINRLRESLTRSGATVSPPTRDESLVLDTASINDLISGGKIESLSQYDIVVVATGGSKLILDTNFGILKDQIQKNTKPAFIILSDGSNGAGDPSIPPGTNLQKFIDIVNGASGMSLSYTKGGNTYTTATPALRNDVSLYSSYFSTLDSIKANAYGAIITGSYEDNKLYGTDPTGALAIFVPQQQMTELGTGACTFLAGDLNMFQNNDTNDTERDGIAKALISAVYPDSPACTPSDVLLLTTEETTSSYNTLITNLQTALESNSINYKVKKGLTSGDINGINFSDYKTVIVATGEQPVSSTNFDILKDQIQNNSDTAFVIFSDGCTSCGTTFGEFAGVLGFSYANGRGGSSYHNQTGAQLHASSKYSGFFDSLERIRTNNNYGRIVPDAKSRRDNVLYGTHADGALAVFMPQTQMNGGACTFLAGDLNIFEGGLSTQHGSVAQTLVNAVQLGSAACNAAPPPDKSQQTVLYLSTAEWNGHGYDTATATADPDAKATCPTYTGSGARGFMSNARTYFADRASKFLDYAGTLSTDFQIATLTNANADAFPNRAKWEDAKKEFASLKDGDVVVVQTAYQLMAPEKAAFIAEQINTAGKNIIFILLLDASTQSSYDSSKCAIADKGVSANLDAIMQDTINTPLHANLTNVGLPKSTQWTSLLNAHKRSAYASSLTNYLNQLNGQSGNSGSTLQCVPQQNILYPAPTPQATGTGYKYPLNNYGGYCNDPPSPATFAHYDINTCSYGSFADPNNSPSVWPELNASSSFGLLIPFWQSNNGKGACVYLGQDNNPFDNGRCNVVGQCGNLVDMFLSLPAGECQTPKPTTSAFGKCTTSQCVLADAPAGTPDDQLAVLETLDADGKKMCDAKVWCDGNVDDRTDYCDESKGEDPATHCCKAKPPVCKPPTGCSSPSAPTTDWPALLGLSALLPLLAARRRRRK